MLLFELDNQFIMDISQYNIKIICYCDSCSLQTNYKDIWNYISNSTFEDWSWILDSNNEENIE